MISLNPSSNIADTMSEYIPKGFHKGTTFSLENKKVETIVSDKNPKERFQLRNRSFEAIDKTFSGMLSEAIKFFLESYNKPVTVVDIGGGTEARAINELKAKYKKYESRLNCVGIDFVIDTDDPRGKLIGDILSLPIIANSVDVAYSRQSLTLIGESNRDKFDAGLTEIARVLKPGGVAFVDKEYWSSLPQNDPELTKLQKKLAVRFSSGEFGVSFLEKLCRVLEGDNPVRFVVMLKNPVNQLLIDWLGLSAE